jgi:hypothetical protein
MDKDWIDKEISLINKDKKKPNKRICNLQFAYLMIFLIPFLIMAFTLNAKQHKFNAQNNVDSGVSFRCSTCGLKQWHDKRNCDWRGHYYCVQCKQRLN